MIQLSFCRNLMSKYALNSRNIIYFENFEMIIKWYITYAKGVDEIHLKEFTCGYLSKLDLQ